MAKKSSTKRKQRTRKTKRRSTGKRGTPPEALPAPPPRPTGPQLLELSTTDFDRPIVRIDGDDFEMRVPDELTFHQFGQQVALGKRMEEISGRVDDAELLEEMHHLMEESVRLLLIDVPDDVIEKLNPGLVMKIVDFFNQLATAGGAVPSADTSSSSPGANDSTGIPEAD